MDMNCLIIGASSYIAKEFIASFQSHMHIVTLTRDALLQDYTDINDKIFQGIDVVINFTAIVHQKNPSQSMAKKINTDLALFLAHKTRSFNIPHFIQMSTIAVYAPTLTHINADSVPAPVSIYGKTKLEADNKLLAMQTNNFKVAIVRPPLVYGYKAPGNMSSLIWLLQHPLWLPFGKVQNSRSILYVENLTMALYKISTLSKAGVFLVRDEVSPSLTLLCTQIRKSLSLKKRLFPLTKSLIHVLIRFKNLPFYKLYDSLTIDDNWTRQNIGHYTVVDFPTSIQQTVNGSTC